LQVLLAGLLSRVGRHDDAEAALAKAGGPGVEALSKATLAHVRVAQERFSDARTVLAGITLAEKDDWLASYFVAAGHDQVARRETIPDAAAIGVAMNAVAAVLARRPNLPHALQLQASLRLAGGRELDEAIKDIERARALAPGREDYLAAHAEILIRRKEFAVARKMIEPIAAGKGWPVLREWAELALRRIKLAEP
jgi:tetratricopeptide (TPR) repeat protein